MKPTLLPLSSLDPAGLLRLARLHISVMHTLLADLGEPLVLRYYEIAQCMPSVIGLCALAQNGDLHGWAMGSPTPSALNARLRQPFTWFAAQILRLAIAHPVVLVELLRSTLLASPANTILPGQIELTYIGVAPAWQWRGLGRALLRAFMERAATAGYKSIVLSVETDNPGAIALYTRSGFHITRTYTEGRFVRHRMQCELPPG